jgi:hypothetical protein
MPHRTAELSDFESYLAVEYPSTQPNAPEAREAELLERQLRLKRFPHEVVLKVAFPELDYANRWCWQQFGPPNGECFDRHSRYPSCSLEDSHSHEGGWLTHWLVKTDYDFGYNEWCFSEQEHRDRFLKFFPEIHWGEGWPA